MAEHVQQPERHEVTPERAAMEVRSAEMRVFRVLAIAGGIVAVIAIVAFLALRGASHRLPNAPALPSQVLVGPRVTLSSLHGRAALVLFWASWCPGCRREAAAVRSFAESAAGRGRIVGVDWADHSAAAMAFLAHERWRFPNLRDRHAKAGISYGIRRLPALFVLNPEGQIAQTLTGTQSRPQLEAALRAAEPRH